MTIDVRLFGTFHLTHNGHANDAINGSPRLQALLAYLLLHHDTPQPRQQIAYQLWPVSSESQARTNLRKLFLQLRRALPDADTYLAFDNQTIQWRSNAPFTCDVVEVQGLLHKLHVNPLDREALPQLFDLYRGELLPSCYDDWIVPLRTQLHQDVMAALDRLVTLLENQRAYDEGIRYAQRLLSLDPLEEKSYQRLMRLRAADGDRTGALRAYQDCVRTLEQELGVDPAPETVALYEQVLNHAPQPTPKGSRTRPAADQPPLIGRQPEWQLLRNAWQRALRGQPGLVTIAGEAGIGKTRLAEELLQWAGQQGILAVRTRSYQAQGALAYAPIAELLQTAAIRPRLGGVNEHRLSHVARLLPELLTEHPNLPPPQPMTESWQRQQFFDALAHAVLADEQPLVLLFDDLQWADGETLSWLHFLLRAAGTVPLLLIGTLRTGEIASDHPLPPLLGSLRRDDLLTEITLAPLTAEEVQALAQSIQEVALGREQLAQLYTDTEGNPLFVVESVRVQQNTAEDLAATGSQSGLPPKIYGVIRSRLTQLSPETQTLINLAAVIGRSFTYDVLVEASTMGEEDVVDSLDELLARQIIREQGAESYDFSHDRIRDVAYNEISRTRRRLLHRRVAEAFEIIHAHDCTTISGLLAEQFKQSGNRAKAIGYLRMAGHHAAGQFIYDDAVRYFTEAYALTTEAERVERYELLLALIAIYHLQSDMQRWRNALAQLALIVDGSKESNLQVPSASDHWRAELLVNQAIYAMQVADYAQAHALATQARRLAQVIDAPALEAKALYWIGNIGFSSANFVEARPCLEAAAQKAKTVGDDLLHVKSLEVLMQVYMFSGGSAQRIQDVLDECMAIHRRTKNLQGQADIYNKYSYLPVAQGEVDFAEAQQNYAQALTLARQVGARIQESSILRNMSVLATCAGDYQQAVQTAQAALHIGQEIQATFSLATAQNYLGFAYFNQGRIIEAQVTQEEALATLQQYKIGQWAVKALTALGWIHYYRGDLATALRYLHEAITESRRLNEERQEAYTLTCLGHVLTQLDRFDEACDAYQQAMHLHERLGQINRAQEPLAGLAHLLLCRHQPIAALDQLEPILVHLQSHTPFYTEEGFHIYLFCCRILHANRDERTGSILRSTYGRLQARAATIDNPEHRHRFWEEMPGHREIRVQWEEAFNP